MLGARLALVTTLLLTGCGVPLGGTAPPERATAPRGTVRVTRVTRGEIAGVITYSGDLRSKPGALVSSRISGRLERLHVEVGSPVREGDTLAELDRASLEVQVVQSEASLAAAEARLAGLKA
ncbi:MAG: biotin/lipoyl-binding protein, partial [Chloroflexi bacterium]|nr:biotin/lipoyl-binding protein [Chloroflexota bacterium]